MEAKAVLITKISDGSHTMQEDLVAVEARYCVYVDEKKELSFTCTPDSLEEMVTGSLFSRGYIRCAEEIDSIRISDGEIFVTRNRKAAPPEHAAAAGPQICTEAIFLAVRSLFNDPDTLFNRTGCAHSCALMRKGEILCAFEDIGRHNALDKAIGFALRSGIPTCECAVLTSGRISGDYMEKIIRAGFPVAVSRAAVTSEAIRLAKEHGITLYGFVRGNSANLYNP